MNDVLIFHSGDDSPLMLTNCSGPGPYWHERYMQTPVGSSSHWEPQHSVNRKHLYRDVQSRPREAGGKSTELDTNWFMNELASSSDYDILYVISPLFPAKSHQRACKTIMCHLVTRSHSRKACKHTAIPSVTPGAVPLSLLRCHVLTWVCALLGASVCSATHLAWWLL